MISVKGSDSEAGFPAIYYFIDNSDLDDKTIVSSVRPQNYRAFPANIIILRCLFLLQIEVSNLENDY